MFPCRRYSPLPLDRRSFLRQAGCGFGAVALSALWAQGEIEGAESAKSDPLAPKQPHHQPRAKSVIYLYMDGGPSQIDTFDPKPRLTKESGQPFAMNIEPTQFNNNGNTFASPWKFQQHGASGIAVSELFPHVARHVDKLAVIRSMTSNFPEHTSANYFLHTGTGVQGRPSMGAWLGFGLGSECRDLPVFVVINGGLIPVGGLDNFNSGFLPASYQASVFTADDPPLANVARLERTDQLQRNKLALLEQLDAQVADRLGRADAVESAIANYELAYRMQTAVPGLMDMNDETEATRRLYGLDATTKGTASFARQCLLARRLVERGVRFVELTCPNLGHDRWDQHSKLEEGHTDNARA